MLQKLRKQPERVKKVILWFVVIIVGIVLLNFWAKGAGERMRDFQAEEPAKEWKLPEIEMPVLEIPEIPEIPQDITSEEFLKKLKELMPELPEQEWKRIEEKLKEIPKQEWKQGEETSSLLHPSPHFPSHCKVAKEEKKMKFSLTRSARVGDEANASSSPFASLS